MQYLKLMRFAEVWYGGYAFQGAVALGLAPILLPLWVGLQCGPAAAGLVVGAFYLGQVISPLCGWLADRFRWHHFIYISGYVFIGLGTAIFPFYHGLWYWVLCALLQGFGIAASNTITGIYIVEFRPKVEWDQRIGWLQTLYGTGQAVGLFLAALFGHNAVWGLYLCGILMLPGLVIGVLRLPKLSGRYVQPAISENKPIHHLCRGPISIFYWMHKIDWRHINHVFKGKFSLYLLAWSLVMIAIWLIFNLYPLLMRSSFGISPTWSSLYYAFGATIGIVVYPVSGWLGQKWGDYLVLAIGIMMCVVALVVMFISCLFPGPVSHWLAPLFFMLIPIAWSPLIVIGTALVPKLSELAQGTALGIFNASIAVTSLISAIGAGLLAQYVGYSWIILLAAISMIIACFLICTLWYCQSRMARSAINQRRAF